ncbi:MAG: hypothetical protein KatS3mg103_1231 [Phycisphaerales bacterium]|nr:MAG: hypothetical protein KatS3mg103_1231 [Phycisphaerales bacterium]
MFHAPQEAGGPAVVHGVLLRCAVETFVREAVLREEVFGPAMLLVVADDAAGMLDAACAVGGALTGSIWMGASDGSVGRRLAATLEHRVGRLVFNATPTGLELCPSLVHGGPYPAALGFGTTAVGPDAAERWLRDIAYQNAPEAMLPKALRTGNPLGLVRLVNGVLEDPDAEPTERVASEAGEPEAGGSASGAAGRASSPLAGGGGASTGPTRPAEAQPMARGGSARGGTSGTGVGQRPMDPGRAGEKTGVPDRAGRDESGPAAGGRPRAA